MYLGVWKSGGIDGKGKWKKMNFECGWFWKKVKWKKIWSMIIFYFNAQKLILLNWKDERKENERMFFFLSFHLSILPSNSWRKMQLPPPPPYFHLPYIASTPIERKKYVFQPSNFLSFQFSNLSAKLSLSYLGV